MSRNRNLQKAKKLKNDEFYTYFTDVENELKHYVNSFKDKVIYCNCDDSRHSNFVKYFIVNFERLGLKRLIATHYKNQTLELFSSEVQKPVKLTYDGESLITDLQGDGDFKSRECIDLLKEADIVVTNPPFSLFREYVAQMIKYDKKFLIIGNINAVKYKNVFSFLKNGKIKLGVNSKSILFKTPEGRKLVPIYWYTNLENLQQKPLLVLEKCYNEKDYPKYDNYDAINVDKIKDIPKDYFEMMGVPITFLTKYNPNQFEILGVSATGKDIDVNKTKIYKDIKRINASGNLERSGGINFGLILQKTKPKGAYYLTNNVEGYLKGVYTRIFIKRIKKPQCYVKH